MNTIIKPAAPLRVAFYTLGCKTNQFETAALEGLFQKRGHTLTAFDCAADVYIVNTCTVTALADKKSRNACRRCKRLNPNAILIVCGCFSQMRDDSLGELGADYILGTANKGRIIALAEGRGDQADITDLWRGERPEFEWLPAGSLEGRTRALLKVQDGCENFCTYCRIPFARGPSRSVPLDIALTEAARLEEEGYREIVITGVEISCYGADLPGKPTLATLIDGICAAAPHCRVRLGSLEPRTITHDFARTLSRRPNLCPHFHLSLQSGCDKVLAAMGRRYTTARYLESCDILRQYFDDPAITTDLIVGFPGESEADFAQTLAFLEAFAPCKTHVFPYSARKGTKAAGFPNQIPRSLREERAAGAGTICRQLEQAYLMRQVGKIAAVLFEQEGEGGYLGHTLQYCQIKCRAKSNLCNKVAEVIITGVENGVLKGEVAG